MSHHQVPGVILVSGSEVQRTNGSYIQGSPEKNFQIINTSFPWLHLDLKRQCAFTRDLASAPFPLHADQPYSKTFFFGLAWAESSSAWCSAWQEGRWLLCCHPMQSAVVDHLEAVEHRGSSFYFESVAWRSKSRQGKLWPAPLPQMSQPAVHQLKILLIRFSMGHSKVLRSLPWAGEFPWVQDHQGNHLASRLQKQWSE